jgi:hypothetical protein
MPMTPAVGRAPFTVAYVCIARPLHSRLVVRSARHTAQRCSDRSGHTRARLCFPNATHSRPSLVALPELCSLARTPCAMPCTRRSRCATHRRSATTSSVRVGSPVQHTINRRCNIQYSHLLGLAQQRRPQCVNAPAWQCALLRSSWSVAARSTHAQTPSRLRSISRVASVSQCARHTRFS